MVDVRLWELPSCALIGSSRILLHRRNNVHICRFNPVIDIILVLCFIRNTLLFSLVIIHS